MNKHIKRFKNLIIDRPLEEVEDAMERREYKQALKKATPLLAAGLGIVGLLVLVLALLYASLGVIGKIIAPVLLVLVLLASYFENRKSSAGTVVIKEPTMEQYVTVGNIVKMAAKRIVPTLELSPIYEETDIKAAKDERIVPKGQIWLFKYRLRKRSIGIIIDTDVTHQVFQNELQTLLDNDNPAGYETVRFVHGGIDECILQIDHVSQSRGFVYVYCCYASEAFFAQVEQRQEDGEDDEIDTADAEF